MCKRMVGLHWVLRGFWGRLTVASLRSLIGMPIVEVMTAVMSPQVLRLCVTPTSVGVCRTLYFEIATASLHFEKDEILAAGVTARWPQHRLHMLRRSSIPLRLNMNVSGTLNILRLFVNPSLCLPHHTISTFDQLPIPLSKAFANRSNDEKNRPDIQAVVLDKDNCFSIPKQNQVYPEYVSKFDELRKAYPGSKLLIVSNSSGTNSDKNHVEADLLERNTGLQVLRHATKKPGCHAEIMEYFRSRPETGVTSESQVAIVGDRLFTDVMMANMMGSYGVWIKDGVIPDHGLVCDCSKNEEAFLATNTQI